MTTTDYRRPGWFTRNVFNRSVAGLTRLGILHQTTLPYSPYQNAKQEAFWGPVEGRLMAMLEDVVLQLQEGLRLKDAELASLHQELAGKDGTRRVIKDRLGRLDPMTQPIARPSPDVDRRRPG